MQLHKPNANQIKTYFICVHFRAVVERRGYEWPPPAANATASCDTQVSNEICYRTGDVRTNQNPGLAILQIILMREHNRIADVLQQINPHFDDELFVFVTVAKKSKNCQSLLQ